MSTLFDTMINVDEARKVKGSKGVKLHETDVFVLIMQKQGISSSVTAAEIKAIHTSPRKVGNMDRVTLSTVIINVSQHCID